MSASAVSGFVRSEPVPSPVLAMALFLVTEAMLFAGLISAYVVLRSPMGVWPPMGQPRLPVEVTAANSLTLLASGFCAWRSVQAFDAVGPKAALSWLRAAFLLGAGFLAVQGWEWVELLRYGMTTQAAIYAGLFYATVGTHAVHVVVALCTLAWGLWALHRGALGIHGLRALRMFSSFVVLVWPPLYVVVYLW